MSLVIKSYRAGLQFLSKNITLLVFIYFINLLFAFLALGPFKSFMTSVFGQSLSINTLADGFDYNLIMDWLNEYGIGVSGSLNALICFIVIYALWSVFMSAGIYGMFDTKAYNLLSFFSSGIKYFFRFIKLSIYVIAIYLLYLGLAYLFFVKDGLHVLEIESEVFLIKRFWILFILLGIFGFLVSIFRDLAKAFIIKNKKSNIFNANKTAFYKTIKSSSLLLGIINIIMLGIIFLIYCGLKTLFSSSTISLFLVSQLYIILKLAYRMIRSVSFSELADRISAV